MSKVVWKYGLVARRQAHDERLWLVYKGKKECGRFLAEREWLSGINEVDVSQRGREGIAEVSYIVNGFMMIWEEQEWKT